MPAEHIVLNAQGVDLSPRFVSSVVVVGSPALAAETIIAQVLLPANEVVVSGIWLSGWAAYTVGTSGTAVTFRIRQTNVGGALVGSSGALTRAAASLQADTIDTIDTAAVLPGQVYVLTMQVTAGAAVSTVSAVVLQAIVV